MTMCQHALLIETIQAPVHRHTSHQDCYKSVELTYMIIGLKRDMSRNRDFLLSSRSDVTELSRTAREASARQQHLYTSQHLTIS